ncbi:MAG: DUF5652 family protein [Nanoarchaeota archaeon]
MVLSSVWIVVIILLAIWELAWKGIALWRAALRKHLNWFVCILIFNTAGILPIIYILKYPIKSKKYIDWR